MARSLFVLACLAAAVFACGCDGPSAGGDAAEGVLQSGPLSADDIGRICSGSPDDGDLGRVMSVSVAERAGIVALMEEAYPGCESSVPWVRAVADEAYAAHGDAFWSEGRPWSVERGRRAFMAVLNDGPHKSAALGYLAAYGELWADIMHVWAEGNADAVWAAAESSDEVFVLFAGVMVGDDLGRLAEIGVGPVRDRVLLAGWPVLPKNAQRRVLGRVLSANWVMQTSGSAQQPQFLSLDMFRLPLPSGVPGFASRMRVLSVRVNNREVARRSGAKAKDEFDAPVWGGTGGYHARVDLRPWLNVAGNYRISARAEIGIYALDDVEMESPLAVLPVAMDRSYRVFAGVETGAPHRNRDAEADSATSAGLSLELCGSDACELLGAGKSVSINALAGRDFYVRAVAGAVVGLPVSARVMARNGGPWREVARFEAYAPQHYSIPVRADVDLGDLCPAGKDLCELELELRPSLTMARRDPRVSRYFGATLGLGRAVVRLGNVTGWQAWDGAGPKEVSDGAGQ